jgi:hypothetical protein
LSLPPTPDPKPELSRPDPTRSRPDVMAPIKPDQVSPDHAQGTTVPEPVVARP